MLEYFMPTQNLTQFQPLPYPSVACLIPCYNESQRISKVLESLLLVPEIHQILCVDDGSTDGTARMIIERFPSVSLLCLPTNQGKTAAVRYGARRLTSEYVLIVDADLKNIRPAEFSLAIQSIQSFPHVEMLVLRRINKGPLTRLARGDVLITGERILKRRSLLDVVETLPARGFQLEVAINEYALNHHWCVRWFPISSLGQISFKKLGILGGLRKEIQMFYSLFSYLGILGYLKQHRQFGRVPVEEFSSRAKTEAV
jgi:glycosyltransferase involved in cell wall biosynthesis